VLSCPFYVVTPRCCRRRHQTTASGSVFDRQCHLLSIFKASLQPLPDPAEDPELKACIRLMRASAGDDPSLNLRVDRLETALIIHQKMEVQNARVLETTPQSARSPLSSSVTRRR